MKSLIRILLFSFASLFVAMALTGCATMFGNNTRSVTVNSMPVMGATIKVNGNILGQTNETIVLPRYLYGINYIQIEKRGYKTTSIALETDVQWVTLWNLLNGWGFILDVATGDIIRLQSTTVTGTLVPES